MKHTLIFAAAWLSLALSGPGAVDTPVQGGGGPITLNLLGVNQGQIFTNDILKITLTATVSGAFAGGTLHIYDGDTLLFLRPFDEGQGGSYSMPYDWYLPPIGRHSLRTVLESGGVTNRMATPIEITVYGAAFGFYGVSNIVTAPTPLPAGGDATVGCQLEIRNQTEHNSNPLRVLLFTTETTFPMTGQSGSLTPNGDTAWGVISTNAGLAPGERFQVNVPLSRNITLFGFRGEFEPLGYRYHVDAFLQQQVGTNWVNVDRTRIISSLVLIQFPYNDPIPPLPSSFATEAYPLLVGFEVVGPPRVPENTPVLFQAAATLSDTSYGAVRPTWTATQFTIGNDGLFSPGDVMGNFDVDLTASFIWRIQRTSATFRVTITNVAGGPTITTQPMNTIALEGGLAEFNVSLMGEPPFTYQWHRNDIPLTGQTNQLLRLSSVTTNDAGMYHVVARNSGGAVTSQKATLLVVVPPTLSQAGFAPNGRFRFVAPCHTGWAYRLQASSDLKTWNSLTTIPCQGDVSLAIEVIVGAANARFYRLEIVFPP